jgi:hypothetical protein
LWAIAAVLLTPLGEHFVKLQTAGEHVLQVTNTQIDATILLHLRADNTLDSVEVGCLNPDTDKQQQFTLHLSDEQSLVNELMLPCKISSFWDGDPYFEVEPQKAELNPQLSSSMFALNQA